MPEYRTQDLHRRAAALLYEKPEIEITKEERTVGKYLNVLAASDLHSRIGEFSGLLGISYDEGIRLVKLYRQNVLGVDRDG